VVTVHNTMSQSGREQGAAGARVWAGLMRTFYPWAAEIVAVSEGAATDLARTTGLPRERVRVVYNPVITSALLSRAARASEHPWLAPGQPPVVLGVGRLTSQKNFALLLHAFATVRRARETRLLILGEGEQRSELEALAVRLGIADDVALPGFRDDAAACMAGAAVFVLSSAWEGLPTVLIEALAVGTRVVSTDCPSGPREILQDGRLGALVPVGDADALARALLRTLEQPRTPVPAEALAPFMSSAAVDRYLSLIGSHP
jgi:glycosyltransferase involved in cell wall biosynthesis